MDGNNLISCTAVYYRIQTGDKGEKNLYFCSSNAVAWPAVSTAII